MGNFDDYDYRSASDRIPNPAIVINLDNSYTARGWTSQGDMRERGKTREEALLKLQQRMKTAGATFTLDKTPTNKVSDRA